MSLENEKAIGINPNWFDSAKLQIQALSERYNINLGKVIEVAAYFAAGFFIGILLKRFGRIFLFSLIIIFIAMLLFDNFHVIQIDWLKIREFTGVSPEETIGSLSNIYFEWLKANISVVIGSLVGVVLGYKVG